jgi:hypothetical protein
MAAVAPDWPMTDEHERFAVSLEQEHRAEDRMMYREQVERVMARRPRPRAGLVRVRPRAHARRRRAVVGRPNRRARAPGRLSDDDPEADRAAPRLRQEAM